VRPAPTPLLTKSNREGNIEMTIQPLLEIMSSQLDERLRTRVLHLPKSLQPALQRERIRTDRTGHPFSWVVFSLNGELHSKRTLQRLAYLIARRARMTDEVGWYDQTAVSVILPVTDETGAACFKRDIVHLAAEDGIYPSAAVYSYPNVSPPSDGFKPKRSLASIFKDRRTMPTRKGDSLGAARDDLHLEFCDMEPFLSRSMPWGKRFGDIVGASLGLVLASPILLGAAIAVKVSSPGPAFFGQQRAGLGGCPFIMYKLRSMYTDAETRKRELMHLNEQDGPAFKIKNDPRITPLGRFLRETSIDELPQLLNVLKGDMSLVGPRPATFDEVDQYRVWYRRRTNVTPCITCIWQVRGRSRVSFEEWMRMDLRYIEQYGFWQDLKLILATLPAVLLRWGAR